MPPRPPRPRAPETKWPPAWCPAAYTLRRWPVSQGHKIQCDAKQLTRPFGDNVAVTLAASRRICASDPRAPSIGRRSGVNPAAPGGAPNLALRVQLLGAMIDLGLPPAHAYSRTRARAGVEFVAENGGGADVRLKKGMP